MANPISNAVVVVLEYASTEARFSKYGKVWEKTCIGYAEGVIRLVLMGMV